MGDAFDFGLATAGGGAFLDMRGGRFNDTDVDVDASVISNAAITSTRFFSVTAAPTGGALAGDRAQLDSVSYTAASSTDPIAWTAVNTHNTTATWIATLNKP